MRPDSTSPLSLSQLTDEDIEWAIAANTESRRRQRARRNAERQWAELMAFMTRVGAGIVAFERAARPVMARLNEECERVRRQIIMELERAQRSAV